MTRINLLPWREQARAQDKRKIFMVGLIMVAIAIMVNLIWFLMLQAQIHHQQKRNAILQQELQVSNTLMTQKKKSEVEKSDTLSQLMTVKAFNNQRYNILELLQFLPKLLPNSAFVTNINVKQDLIELQGYAPAEIQVSEFVKNLQQQPAVKEVHLQELTRPVASPDKMVFTITLKME